MVRFSILKSRSSTIVSANDAGVKGNLLTSFLAGIILTLGDVKAIIFYASLFPLFIDLSSQKVTETLIVISITIVSVGGVKAFYAISAIKVVHFTRKLKFEKTAKKITGGAMIGAGSYLIVKT